jgi:hypothetical protein
MQAEGFDSYYAVLGVRPTATEAEIRKAYRQRAIASHPDKGGDADTFKSVAEAYEVLSDAGRRATYDRFGKAGLRSGGGGGARRTWAPGTSPEEIFKHMFGDVPDLAALFREMQAAAARGDGINWQQGPPPTPPARTVLSRTPAKAVHRLTAWTVDDAEVARVGAGKREVWMPSWQPAGSAAPVAMLPLLEAADDDVLLQLASSLAADGAVALPLGLEDEVVSRARKEAAAAVGMMQPAALPGGAPGRARGDVCVRLTQYVGALLRDSQVAAPPSQRSSPQAPPAPMLQGVREALGAVGAALTPHLADAKRGLSLQLTEKSDAFVTCVPRDTPVAAHFDSACTAPGAPLERKLSLTLYLGTADEPSPPSPSGGSTDDGRELLYDEFASTWRALTPRAGTLLLALSDRALHTTPPIAGPPRLSVSLFFLGGYLVPDGASATASATPPPRPQPPPPPPQWQPQPTVDDSDDSDEEGAMDELG